MTTMDIILIIEILGFLLITLGVSIIEGGYYELKLLTPGISIPKILKKTYFIVKFKISIEKLVFTIWRAGLFILMVNTTGWNAYSILYTVSIWLMWPQLHEAVYNWTRYTLGNEKYKEWWTYLSPSDGSLIEMNYRTRFPMLIIGLILTILQMIWLGVFN